MSAAIVVVALVVYPVVLVTIAVIWWRRAVFGLSAGKAAVITVELLACPAFLPNLVRKITVATSVEADAAQIVLATAAADAAERFLARLESRAETLINESSPDEQLEERLRPYLAAVRGAR